MSFRSIEIKILILLKKIPNPKEYFLRKKSNPNELKNAILSEIHLSLIITYKILSL